MLAKLLTAINLAFLWGLVMYLLGTPYWVAAAASLVAFAVVALVLSGGRDD